MERTSSQLKAHHFHVETACSPEEALRLYEQSEYDVVVLDVYLPDMNGYELCRAMRDMCQEKMTGIAILAGQECGESVVQAMAVGADDFMTKDTDPEIIIARIAAVALLNCTLLKRRRHLAYMLWMLVLLKCVTPPLWSSSVGLFSWAGREKVVIPAVVPVEYAFTPMKPAERILRLPDRRDGFGDERSTAVEVRATAVAGTEVPPVRPTLSWTRLLAGIWLAGCGLFTVWVVRRQIACRRAVRRFSERCENPAILARFGELAKEIGVRRDVELFITSLNIGPATFGVLKSRIILPESLVATGSQRNLDLILTHELTHVRRWDMRNSAGPPG